MTNDSFYIVHHTFYIESANLPFPLVHKVNCQQVDPEHGAHFIYLYQFVEEGVEHDDRET